MSAPTADDYRAALALIDRHAGAIKTGLSYWPPSGEVAAALAVARAAVVSGAAWRDMYDPSAGDAMDRDEAVNAADATLDAAVADLVALAVGGA